MDPLTALGLAGNIMQVVSFGCEVASACQQVYQSGITDTGEHAQYLSSQLYDITQALHLKLASYPSKSLTREQQELRGVAVKCAELSSQMRKKLDQIFGGDSSRRPSSIACAFKSRWYRRDVDQLQARLVECQNVLQTRLLTHLSSQQQAIAIRDGERFDELDDNTKRIVENLTLGAQKVIETVKAEADNTKHLIQQEGDATRDHLTQGLQTLQVDESKEKKLQRLHKSFRSPDINMRRNDVPEAHFRTYEWIFDRKKKHSWDSLTEWLEGGSGMYWINGKPGAGKSTLMKFIAEDKRTMDALGAWSTPHTPVLVTYFFWLAGSKMQRSVKGLMCSILFQLLRGRDKELMQLLADSGMSEKQDPADWSLSELPTVLSTVIKWMERPICILIDGLDEIDPSEGPDSVLEVLNNLLKHPQLKIVASSRPQNEYQVYFQESPQLKLQDLTAPDMEIVALDLLAAGKEVSTTNIKIQQAIDLILEKSDGIFLWVHLAIKSVQRGLRNADDWDEILKRVQGLPPDLSKLYQQMWERLNEDSTLYREEAALYFILLVASIRVGSQQISCFEMMAASDLNLQSLYLKDETHLTDNQLVAKCQRLQTRIVTRCAGLLEIYDSTDVVSSWNIPSTLEIDGTGLRQYAEDKRIRFIHRTAKDFLTESEFGKHILSWSKLPTHEAQACVIKAALVALAADVLDLDMSLVRQHMILMLSTDLELQQKELIQLQDQVYRTYLAKQYGFAKDKDWFRTLVEKSYTPPEPHLFNYYEWAIGYNAVLASFGFLEHFRELVVNKTRPINQEYLDALLMCTVAKNVSFSSKTRFAQRHLEMVKLLLEHGANPNLRHLTNSTRQLRRSPLEEVLLYAASLNAPKNMEWDLVSSLIEIFLEHGADLSMRTIVRLQPAEYGSFHQHNDLDCIDFNHAVEWVPLAYIAKTTSSLTEMNMRALLDIVVTNLQVANDVNHETLASRIKGISISPYRRVRACQYHHHSEDNYSPKTFQPFRAWIPSDEESQTLLQLYDDWRAAFMAVQTSRYDIEIVKRVHFCHNKLFTKAKSVTQSNEKIDVGTLLTEYGLWIKMQPTFENYPVIKP